MYTSDDDGDQIVAAAFGNLGAVDYMTKYCLLSEKKLHVYYKVFHAAGNGAEWLNPAQLVSLWQQVLRLLLGVPVGSAVSRGCPGRRPRRRRR